MTEMNAGLIDVFADAPLSGNPLAVVENADRLTDNQLRRIAGEFNQAETTFLMRSERAHWKLRSLTASGAEVFGAGHNALGAWLWMGYRGLLGNLETPKTFQQEIGDDVLAITLDRRGDRIYGQMKQASLRLAEPLTTFNGLAEALGISIDKVMNFPPPRAANTGAPHLMVRLQDKACVDQVKPLAEKLVAILGPAGAEGCYVYAFDEATPAQAYARFFNPTVGLWEDSATGTAAGPLTAYLGFEGLLAADNSLIIEQGTNMGRPSFLHVRLTPQPEISGTGVVVFQGTLQI
jgi:PhzF family phenazine biosynthesis protein